MRVETFRLCYPTYVDQSLLKRKYFVMEMTKYACILYSTDDICLLPSTRFRAKFTHLVPSLPASPVPPDEPNDIRCIFAPFLDRFTSRPV